MTRYDVAVLIKGRRGSSVSNRNRQQRRQQELFEKERDRRERRRAMAGVIHSSPSLTLLVLLILVSWETGRAVNPGLRTALTSKGLNYILSVGVPILEAEISTLTIPDISGRADTPVGHISYTLSKSLSLLTYYFIKLDKFVIPTYSLTSSSAGLSLQASGIEADINANWHYREDSWPHISDSGSCSISMSSVSLAVKVIMGADSKGHATLSCTGCSLGIGHLSIHFDGGASWLYNLFDDQIADSLKGSIQSQVCDLTKNTINTQGNAALESVPVVVKIDSTSELDYRLLQAPTFTSEYMETQHKGEFFSIDNPVEAPFTPPPLPSSFDTSKMLYVWLTDYIADTAGFVYERAGALQYNITASMIPSSFPFQLNTKSFLVLIPELYKKFPDWEMQLDLNATKPPDVTFSPTVGGNLTVFGDMAAMVISPTNKSMQLAFLLGMIVYADAKVAITTDSSGNEIAVFNATFLKVDLTLLETNVGDFNANILQTVANLVCTTFIIPIINKYGSTGVPIPTVDGVSLVDPSITFGQDYVVIASDIKYVPTSLPISRRLTEYYSL